LVKPIVYFGLIFDPRYATFRRKRSGDHHAAYRPFSLYHRPGSGLIALNVPVSDALEYMDFNVNSLTTAYQGGMIQFWTCMPDRNGVIRLFH